MLALTLGLGAALAWAVHDLLARKLSQSVALLPIILTVLGSGCLALVAPVLLWGEWHAAAAWPAASSGLAFACAIGALYKAFSIAPVRLVSPIIGAYPMLSLIFAAAQGRPILPMEWLAVFMIILGIAMVALFAAQSDNEGNGPIPVRSAVFWSGLSACAFATTFALGQEAARLGSEITTIFVSRLCAFCAILALLALRRQSPFPTRSQWKILIVMGVIDAAALGVVMASGRLPQAEYASISSALFGVLTVILAAHYLKEKVRPSQIFGIAIVFAGIALLSVQA